MAFTAVASVCGKLAGLPATASLGGQREGTNDGRVGLHRGRGWTKKNGGGPRRRGSRL